MKKPQRVRDIFDKRGIRNPRLLEAFRAVPRDQFLTEELQSTILRLDEPAPLPEGQTMPPPDLIAIMLDALDPGPGQTILEIGTGTGYTAALLGKLAGKVYSLERLPPLVEFARRHIRNLNLPNVEIHKGDGATGLPDEGPYDGILISAAVEDIPRPLLEQLKPDGTLVTFIHPHQPFQTLVRVHRTADGGYEREELGEHRFTALFGDILVDMGSISRSALERAAEKAEHHRKRLGDELLEEGLVEEVDIYRALARQRGLRYANVDEVLQDIDRSLVESLPRPYLEFNRIIPIRHTGAVLSLATSDPNVATWQLSQTLNAQQVDIVLISPTDYRRIWRALDLEFSGSESKSAEELEVQPVDEELIEPTGKFESHLISLFEAILLDAIGERASDIHLERYEEKVRVRFRVDGRLRDITRYTLNPFELSGIINVVKVNSNLDIAERRLPQGGRFRRKAGAAAYDLRVQTQPSLYGEHLIIRILSQDKKLLTIEDLGFPADLASRYRRLLRSPQGLLLVVGPTGSGKSTTLYAGLQILAHDETRKVITAEDPIEYAIHGIQQAQIRPHIGFAFADAMRAFVREDPDVILVGEIRDAETALEALRASQTGHLVLSTLHCNDTVDAVQRLIDLEQHPNSIASELMAVMSQRLARRLCNSCRTETTPEPEIVAEMFPNGIPSDFRCYTGEGCARCKGYGMRGRVAVLEYLPIGPTMRKAISRLLPVDELRDLAHKAGLTPMRTDAIRHVEAGRVPLSELPRILSVEQIAPHGTLERTEEQPTAE